MLDPSGNIHLTFRLPDDLLAFIHKKYQPFHRYKCQQKTKTCLELIEALFRLKLHLDNVLAITEQMMTLTTTLTGLF